MDERLVDEGDRAAVRRGGARSPSPRSGSSPRRSGRGRGRRRGAPRGSGCEIMLRASSGSRMSPSTGLDRRVGHVAEPGALARAGVRARRRSGGRSRRRPQSRRRRGGVARRAICLASFSGSHSSSLSWKAIQVPRASATPRLRAPAAPRLRGAAMTRRRGSVTARAAARVPSVEPSSTTTSSKSATGLAQHAVDRRADGRGPVVGRDHHGDGWRDGRGGGVGAHAGSSVGRPSIRRGRRHGYMLRRSKLSQKGAASTSSTTSRPSSARDSG